MTDRIPILKMGKYLLVSIQVDMHDRMAMTLQDDLTARIVATHAKGVLIDISAVEMVDSFMGRMLGDIAAMSRVLDAETVVVGMRPAVAITARTPGTLAGSMTCRPVRGFLPPNARVAAIVARSFALTPIEHWRV